MPAAFDITVLNRDPELVAALVQAGDVFSLLVRQVVVPPPCVGLVWTTARQPRLAPGGSVVESGDVRELLLARTTSFSLDFTAGRLTSKDGFDFSATASVAVQIIPERTELASFRHALLGGGDHVRTDDLRRHSAETVQAALFDFVSARAASALLTPAASAEFEPVLTERFKPLGFESGLALTGDVRVTLESSDYLRTRQAEQAAAARRKQGETEEQLRSAAAQARLKHLAEIGELLDRVRGMAADNRTGIRELIGTFDPARRGALYEGLLAAGPASRPTAALLLVAGQEIIALDPADPQEPRCRQPLTPVIGPLRSIRLAHRGGETLALVGARLGVLVLAVTARSEPDGSIVLSPRGTFAYQPPFEPRGGVNASLLIGDCLYATHSELGLLQWPYAPSEPPQMSVTKIVGSTPAAEALATSAAAGARLCLIEYTTKAKTVRNLQVDESGRLWFSADDRVIGWSPDRQAAPIQLNPPSVVESLLVSEGFVYAGLRNGSVVYWHAANPGEMETVRGPAGSAVESLAWLAGGGVPRLLVADGCAQLELRVLGDAYRAEYRCNQPLRWGFAADDWIVAVNDRRDQLVIWPSATPGAPSAVVSIGRLCGHSIQDVILLPAC
jgi:hypothetical protein